MANKCEIDRLSELPDNILTCNIFSHLSLRDVVRTSVLSSRWRYLWKLISHLDFSEEFFEYLKLPIRSFPISEGSIMKYINDIIDNILLLHSGHVERFSIHACNASNDILNLLEEVKNKNGLHLDQWIHHEALNEVKHMSLRGYYNQYTMTDIPPSLFACRLLRDLKLQCFRFTGIPTGFYGFRFLQSCFLRFLPDLTDDGIKQLIGLSPLLHKLELVGCRELINLKIQAPNFKSLKIESCCNMESLTVDCPQLVELGIENCYILFEVKMNACVLFHDLHTSDVRIPKEHSMLSSLRKLTVKECSKISCLSLITTLGCFPNLEEVHIQILNADHYSEQERAKCEVAADSRFQSLKEAHLDISSVMKKDEAVMLAFLLKNAPLLNTLTLTLPYCPINVHDKGFISKVLDLQNTYEKVDIRMEIDEEWLDATCLYDYLNF